jgi:hypothetical protein
MGLGRSSGGEPKTLRTKGYALYADQRVREAMEEYGRHANRSMVPAAITAISNVLRDPKHRDHIRAATS